MRLLPLLSLLVVACGDPSPAAAPPQAEPRAHLVEVAVAQTGRLSYTADRAGSLRAVREVTLMNQEEGRVVAVVPREGDRVREGQTLVRYDDRLLRAELDKASALRQQAERNHERNRQLIERGFIHAEALSRSDTELEIARADERALSARVAHMRVDAPFAGVVTQRHVEPGAVTPRHTPLLALVDPSTLVTDVDVSELVLPRLRVGDTAGVRIDALGDAVHPGRILRIHPTIDPATRTGRVEVALAPVPAGARPGHFSRVELATGRDAQVLVPLAALQRDAQGEHVFVLDGERVRRAGVGTGLRLVDRVEVRSGVAVGDKVVVRGFVGLEAGRRVKPVEPGGGH